MDIAVIVSNKCNLGCKHCLVGEQTNELMSKETANKVAKFINTFKGTYPDVTFTGGGEPFLNMRALETIVYKLLEKSWYYGFKFKTNGTFLLDKDALKLVSDLLTHNDLKCPGVSIQISNSKYHKESRTADLDNAIAKLKDCVDRGSYNSVFGVNVDEHLQKIYKEYHNETLKIDFTWENGEVPYRIGRAEALKESLNYTNCCPINVLGMYDDIKYCRTLPFIAIMPNGDIDMYCGINTIKLGHVDYSTIEKVTENYLKWFNEAKRAVYTDWDGKRCLSDCEICKQIKLGDI